jgi:starch-binding outer membrane protein, SusD/RagB family
MKKGLFKIIMLILVLGASCTKLDENILDESSISGQSDKQIADGLIAPVYARLPDIYRHTTLFALSEISTDEAILPYRGGTDWGDNGIYISMHKHETVSSDVNVRETWGFITQALSRAVIAISALPENKDANAKVYLAEARAMRAFYNMHLLDGWGLAVKKEKPDDFSTILRGQEAIDYIAAELIAAEAGVEATTGPGRLTKGGVWGLLAKLYLNAAVWRDPYAASFTFNPADMDKVIDYSTRVINSGSYALSPDYFAIFGNNNTTNKELIFAVDQRWDLNGHNRLAYFSLSGDQRPLPAFPAANGTDGPGITPDWYRTWVNAYAPRDPSEVDPRFSQKNLNVPASGADTCYTAADFKVDRGILRGQQYGIAFAAGAFLRCPDGRLRVTKLFNASRSRPTYAVDFTETINYSTTGSDYSTGFRVLKYEFSARSSTGRNAGEADISIVRLADVYLMRAEAKLRKGDAAGALIDANAIRSARTGSGKVAPPLTSLTTDILLRERGFELYWEFQRRTDLIRFGKYEDSWTEKNNNDKNKRVFPIPQTAIDGASNLTGYLVQNRGY